MRCEAKTAKGKRCKLPAAAERTECAMHAGIMEHVGPPFAEVDEYRLQVMTTAGVPEREMADALGVSRDVLHRRYRTKMQEWRGNGNAALRCRQFMNAIQGDNTMLKFLGMNRLGQSDRAIIGTIDLTKSWQAEIAEDGSIVIRAESDED